MKKLVVIDGKSVFYRGYYAMGNLSTRDGTPTSGVFGFAVIAMEIVRRMKPDKVVVAWDKAKTSTSQRTAIYADYKAGRVKPPEDFYTQIPLLRDLIDALGWGFLEADGYEADDIIGTLAKKLPEGWEMAIISSDLDMLQVVDENVKMFRVLQGFSHIEEMDVAAVEEKYGIKKKQFLDLKALKGDSSDNIPGVLGIGEKGAVKLLAQYGDLDGIYEHVEEISGKVGEKLRNGKESAYMSYKLAKIMTDAPVSIDDVPDFKVDGDRILAELNKLEFRSVIRRFEREILGGVKEQTVEPATDDAPELPEDVLVLLDVKKSMHENQQVAEKVLAGAEFWDLTQGKFLLDPLARQDEGAIQPKREYWRQKEEFQKAPQLFRIFKDYDLPLIPVLYKMEERGILIDREYFAGLKKEYEAEVAEITKQIYELAGQSFNLNSPYQLSDVLFGVLGLPTKGIKKGARGYSTGAKELEKLQDLHPIVAKILEYREASKLLSTYILPMPELADQAGRVHTTFTQNVTSTGRLSSVNPNLQNIPVRTEAGRKIRTGFVAAEGKCLVSADYSQFELRLAAVLAGDDNLTEDFNSGIDIHTKTAAEVFGVPMEQVSKVQRRAAKTINFGVLYGMSARGLGNATGMSLAEAKQFIDEYFKVRRPIREYLDDILRQAREVGYVETFYGRRRPTPDVKSSNFMVRASAERAAQNMPIQGTEADLMKRAMIMLDKKLPEGAEMILQIHDSVVVECAKEIKGEVMEILKTVMEGVAPELPIKLAVEVTSGQNWGEL